MFCSHEGKRLIEHLKEVYQINQDKIDEEFKPCFKIISYCHDFGKFTSYFQRYLNTKKRGKFTDHGFLSALFAAFCSLKSFREDSFLPLISYSVVLHHHGDLENISEDLPSTMRGILDSDFRLTEKIEIAKEQIKDIAKNKDLIKEEYSILNFEDYFLEFLNCDIVDVLKSLKKLQIKMEMAKKENLYFIHQLLYSALISADKLSAAKIEIPYEMFAGFEVLNREREKDLENKDMDINKIRSEIFEKIQKNIEKNYKNSKIFTITSPTGTGKTFAGFFAAVKLRELLGDNRRIIYSLPFTSIIEQNYDVLYRLHKNIEGFEKESGRYLLKHHSLANIKYESDEYDFDNLQSELLIENWSSGIVVTTFVQLFETLIGTRNRMLKKLINLKGSIIILDEIQAIDISLLPLVEFVLERACEIYDLRIVMMTATKPYILKNSIELLEDNQKYFFMFNRTTLLPDLNNKKLSTFLDEFKERIEDKSYLIVCNTISSSLDVYNNLKELNRPVFYLSTNLIPIHRRERIKNIKKLLDKGEKIILVSTQVVEAGVDVDFDVVIRDIGPLDSIIQCAGRCNRNGLKDNGLVYVYSLVPEDNDVLNFGFGKYVYGIPTLEITKKILKEPQYSEGEYFDIVSDYFKLIQQDRSKEKSKKFINSIKTLNFSQETKDALPLYKFSLIEDNPGFMDAFVIYDDLAQSTFKRYCDMLKLTDYYDRRREYLEIKNIIRDYTVSLPIKYHSLFDEQFGLYILPRERVVDCYNEEIGFIRQEKSYDIF
ncbi:CRISPR-associated helicase/endonuclease Cas3 [Caloramator australicus]|uniref:CRISPR-associated helicase Cas3 n=1 Tax=Caloramator australicus RC3 TaxID=857293 RepID=I7K5W8_9CLOT|nr:CRISPR-associated helicase/endonuclease Cas3 [Caloramator australicus]CCJ32924.1 CRISPR-associated helicase Cas3 [Caloramator australicus RC3]